MYLVNHDEMFLFGKKLSKYLRRGDLVVLEGDLGAGKTTITQGIAEGLGVTDKITSPTFVFISEYYSGEIPLFHMDFYRLESEEMVYDLGIEEYFCRDGICVIEWAERIKSILPSDYYHVKIDRDDIRNGRVLTICDKGNSQVQQRGAFLC